MFVQIIVRNARAARDFCATFGRHLGFGFQNCRQMSRHNTTFFFSFFQANVSGKVATSVPKASREAGNDVARDSLAELLVIAASIAVVSRVGVALCLALRATEHARWAVAMELRVAGD